MWSRRTGQDLYGLLTSHRNVTKVPEISHPTHVTRGGGGLLVRKVTRNYVWWRELPVERYLCPAVWRHADTVNRHLARRDLVVTEDGTTLITCGAARQEGRINPSPL